MEDDINLLRESWVKASHDLGFTIITPYTIEMDNGKKEDVFAFIPDYGRPNGTIIGLWRNSYYNADENFMEWAKKKNIYYSFINIQLYMNYDKLNFQETLIDWGYFGESANKPDWMNGFPNPWIEGN